MNHIPSIIAVSAIETLVDVCQHTYDAGRTARLTYDRAVDLATRIYAQYLKPLWATLTVITQFALEQFQAYLSEVTESTPDLVTETTLETTLEPNPETTLEPTLETTPELTTKPIPCAMYDQPIGPKRRKGRPVKLAPV